LSAQRQARTERREGARRARVHAAAHEVGLRRAYDGHGPRDGLRVLVDRLWPRGMSKKELAVDFWLKDLAPSDALRRWYGHRPCRWASFAAKYRAELARQKRDALLRLLDELRHRDRVTLLYGARDTARNHAVVLRDVLEERRHAEREPHLQRRPSWHDS
jgi:uncharacterized protein YeaO (DUF488 family)